MKHDQMKKTLSGAFSTKALAEQEAIVSQTIDRFVERVGEEGGPSSRGVNMTKWYEMVAFDILGELGILTWLRNHVLFICVHTSTNGP